MTRVRFAPSPTGNLHIGTLRTALFNWIFARHQKGTYILRVEDTDLNRSDSAYEQTIYDGLEWLGLNENEGPRQGGEFGPYRQSERIALNHYQKVADKLVDSGHAYPCFCTPDDLTAERETAQKAGRPYLYSRKCLHLNADQVAQKKADQVPYTLRFKMPSEGQLEFMDLIRGAIQFDLALLGDFVIVKSDQSPSYNFACVVDDAEMKISHVIRGEDHISNTPRQICVFNALGLPVPKFAHMPMILGPDKAKLSKRHGATNVVEYRNQGFLADAMFNYLSLLGWTPPDEQEILDREEICRLFELGNVNKAGAVFDLTKLKWMNGQYIRKMDELALFEAVTPYFSDEVRTALAQFSESDQVRMVKSVQDNLEVLSDINGYLDVYLMGFEGYKKKITEFEFNDQERDVLARFHSQVAAVSGELSDAHIKTVIDAILSETGLGKGKVMKPIRFGCSAVKSGPHLFDFLIVTGKEQLLKRLDHLL